GFDIFYVEADKREGPFRVASGLFTRQEVKEGLAERLEGTLSDKVFRAETQHGGFDIQAPGAATAAQCSFAFLDDKLAKFEVIGALSHATARLRNGQLDPAGCANPNEP